MTGLFRTPVLLDYSTRGGLGKGWPSPTRSVNVKYYLSVGSWEKLLNEIKRNQKQTGKRRENIGKGVENRRRCYPFSSTTGISSSSISFM
jgi:hypothetical protein